MLKRILLVMLVFILMGCSVSTEEEEDKSEYLTIKSNLLEVKDEDYILDEDLPLDIVVEIDRMDEEEVDYRVIFSNPKEDMYDIEAMVVHNYYNEDLFPTLGLFDEKKELLVNEEDSIIELEDNIETNKNLSSIYLELKIYFRYKDKDGKKKEIYYKTT